LEEDSEAEEEENDGGVKSSKGAGN